LRDQVGLASLFALLRLRLCPRGGRVTQVASQPYQLHQEQRTYHKVSDYLLCEVCGLLRKMDAGPQWPQADTPGRNRHFDNVSGHAETFELCSKQMFIAGDAFEIEACVVDVSGKLILLVWKSLSSLFLRMQGRETQ
jgi:hypothetical protein